MMRSMLMPISARPRGSRDRAHRRAGPAVEDDPVQDDHQDDGDPHTEHVDVADGNAEHGKLVAGRDGQRSEGARVGPEDELPAVLEQEAESDGRDQRVQLGRIAQRPVAEAFDQEARGPADGHRHQRDGDGAEPAGMRGLLGPPGGGVQPIIDPA